jgi:hypothetical protein
MTKSRKKFDAAFKAKVALEALREDSTRVTVTVHFLLQKFSVNLLSVLRRILSETTGGDFTRFYFLIKRTHARSSDRPVTSRVPEPTHDQRRQRSDRGEQPVRRRAPGCGETTAPGTQWEKNRNSQAAQQSFEPTRLCRRIAARDGSRQKRSRPEMAPQRLDKIESAPGNGMVSEACTHKIWYRGVRLPCPTPADVPRPGGTPREGARRALGVGCRLGSRVDQGRRRTRSWSLSRGGGAMEAEIFRLAKP